MELQTERINMNEIKLGGPIKNYNYHSDESIQELTDNIEKIGLINPIIVWWNHDEDCYHVAAGERRFRAIKRLNWEEVEAKVIDPSGDKDILQYQVSENRIREYSWLIEARQIYELTSGEDSKSVEFIADLFNLSIDTIQERKRVGFLLSVSTLEIQDFLALESRAGNNESKIAFETLRRLSSGLLRPKAGGAEGGATYDPFPKKIIDKYLKRAINEEWTTNKARAEMEALKLKEKRKELKEQREEYKEKIESQVSEKLEEKAQEIREEMQEELQGKISKKEEKISSLREEMNELEENLIEAQEQDSEEVDALKDQLDKFSKQRKELEEKKEGLQEELRQEKERGLSEEEKEDFKQEVRPRVKEEVKEQLKEEREELNERQEEILQKEKDLAEKEEELSDREGTVEKKEEDLEQRILKPKQHHRRIIKGISQLRGDLSSVDSAWLNLLDESELNELIEQFKNLEPDIKAVINLIIEVNKNETKSTKSEGVIEGSEVGS